MASGRLRSIYFADGEPTGWLMEIAPQPEHLTQKPSQADRDAALASLREEAARERLTMEQFGDRVDAVLAAENIHELRQALAGLESLPVLDGSRTVSTVVAFLSTQRRAGRWRLPDRLRVFGVLGDVHLDLGAAVCAEESVEISTWSLFGDVALDVPAGVEVELAGFNILGNRELAPPSARPVPGTPRIRIRARAAFGDVVVRSTGAGAGVGGALDRGGSRGGAPRRRMILAVTAVLLFLVFLIWDRGGGGRETATAAQPATTRPAVRPANPPAARAAPGDAAPAPDVVGQRLADAQDAFGSAGFTDVEAVDASSAGRVVVDPHNWVVRGQTPAGGAAASLRSRVTLLVIKPGDAAGSGGRQVARGVVPKVVCMNLQAAQALLHEAGFTNLRSTDGSARGRMQIIDRNWVVTAQSPPAGHRSPATTQVVLTSVKHGEPTGAAGCPA
jgi:hypothetical protein